jgi:hypothetical protein
MSSRIYNGKDAILHNSTQKLKDVRFVSFNE